MPQTRDEALQGPSSTSSWSRVSDRRGAEAGTWGCLVLLPRLLSGRHSTARPQEGTAARLQRTARLETLGRAITLAKKCLPAFQKAARSAWKPRGSRLLASGPISQPCCFGPKPTTTALTPRTFTCWAQLEARLCPSLGLCPGSPGTPAGWSLPPLTLCTAPSRPAIPPGLGEQPAPDHKDPLLAGDPVNTQETEKRALGPVRPRAPPQGKGTVENGAPLFLATSSPQPRTGSSFSGHICPSVAPSRPHIKTPETPTALL